MSSDILGHLVVIKKKSGKDGSIYSIKQDTCSFGRDLQCEIRIQNPKVSQRHATIRKDDNGKLVLFTDCPYNATLINGSIIDGSHTLCDGDVISIAERSFRFHLPSQEMLQTPKRKTTSPLKRSSKKKTKRETTPFRERNLNSSTVSSDSSTRLSTMPKESQPTLSEPMRRRSVAFGSPLSPEIYDRDLPPITPLKRGASPRPSSVKKRSMPGISSILKTISEEDNPSRDNLIVDTSNIRANGSVEQETINERIPKLNFSEQSSPKQNTPQAKETIEQDLIELSTPKSCNGGNKQVMGSKSNTPKMLSEENINKVYKKALATPVRNEIQEGKDLNKVYKKALATPVRNEIQEGKDLNKVYKKALATPTVASTLEKFTRDSPPKAETAIRNTGSICETLAKPSPCRDQSTVRIAYDPTNMICVSESTSLTEISNTDMKDDSSILSKKNISRNRIQAQLRLAKKRQQKAAKIRIVNTTCSAAHPVRRMCTHPGRVAISQKGVARLLSQKQGKRRRLKKAKALKSALCDEALSLSGIERAHPVLPSPIRRQLKQPITLKHLYNKSLTSPIRASLRAGIVLRPVTAKSAESTSSVCDETISYGKNVAEAGKATAFTEIQNIQSVECEQQKELELEQVHEQEKQEEVQKIEGQDEQEEQEKDEEQEEDKEWEDEEEQDKLKEQEEDEEQEDEEEQDKLKEQEEEEELEGQVKQELEQGQKHDQEQKLEQEHADANAIFTKDSHCISFHDEDNDYGIGDSNCRELYDREQSNKLTQSEKALHERGTPESNSERSYTTRSSAKKKQQTRQRLTARLPEQDLALDVKSMTCKELRAELESRGLAVSGRKAELQQRLALALEPCPPDEEIIRGPKLYFERRKLSMIPEVEELECSQVFENELAKPYQEELCDGSNTQSQNRVNSKNEDEDAKDDTDDDEPVVQKLNTNDSKFGSDDSAIIHESRVYRKNVSADSSSDCSRGYRTDFSEDEIKEMKVVQLKYVLSEIGLSTSGRKTQLQKRLLEHISEQVSLHKGDFESGAEIQLVEKDTVKEQSSDYATQADDQNDNSGSESDDEIREDSAMRDTDSATLSCEQVKEMKVKELRKTLSYYEASTHGRKAELQERLIAIIDSQHQLSCDEEEMGCDRQLQADQAITSGGISSKRFTRVNRRRSQVNDIIEDVNEQTPLRKRHRQHHTAQT
eukprot:gene8159-794_t